MKRLRLVVALLGCLAFAVLACHWASLGYVVAAFVAVAAGLGWIAGIYPEEEEEEAPDKKV